MMSLQDLNNKLPQYKAPQNIWDCIEEQLDILENEHVDKKITTKLPTYHAPEMFETIAPPPKVKTLRLSVIKAAATIIILLSLTIGIKQLRNKAHIEISYSMEMNTETESYLNQDLFEFDTDFKTILNQKCKVKPGVCEQNDYEELMTQLNEIETETKALQEAFQEFNSPNIESHLIRLINDKIKLENYILKLFS